MDIQFVIISFVLLCAISYAIRRICHTLRQDSPCCRCEGCKGCEGCEQYKEMSKHGCEKKKDCCHEK